VNVAGRKRSFKGGRWYVYVKMTQKREKEREIGKIYTFTPIKPDPTKTKDQRNGPRTD
jgi:hypothetical protein